MLALKHRPELVQMSAGYIPSPIAHMLMPTDLATNRAQGWSVISVLGSACARFSDLLSNAAKSALEHDGETLADPDTDGDHGNA
jgi:hypothetical protein